MQHTWKIYDLKRTTSNGVVTEITYACESQLSGSSTRKIGNLTVTGSADDADFIAYDDLTEDTVLGWVTDSVDTASIETVNSSSVAASIVARAAVTESNGTPW